MTFIEWTKREEHSNQNAANPKTMNIRQERDRLTSEDVPATGEEPCQEIGT